MFQMPTRSVLVAAMFALLFASSASANIAAPERPTPPPPPAPDPAPPVSDKATDLSLTIKLHDNGKPMKLELPAKQAGAVKGAAGAEAGDAAGGAAGGAAETRMVVAAVMLSLGAAAGGLWLARRRSSGAAMAVASALTIAAAGLWASEAFGNKPYIPPPTSPKPAGLTIRIESNPKGDAAVLHISEEQLKAITEQLAAQKKPAVPNLPNPGTRSAPPAAPK